MSGRGRGSLPAVASLLPLLSVGLDPAPVAARAFTLSGEIRPRTEIRDPAADGGSESFTSMRTG